MLVRCNKCMISFEEERIVYDGEEDEEYCPECGESGGLMDLVDDQMKEILTSFQNGQKRQMVDQIDEVGLQDFVSFLEIETSVDDSTKYKILNTYLKLSYF